MAHVTCVISARAGSELAHDGTDDGLPVPHLLDAHLLQRVHQLFLAVTARHNVLQQLHRRHLLLFKGRRVLRQAEVGQHGGRVRPPLRGARTLRRQRRCHRPRRSSGGGRRSGSVAGGGGLVRAIERADVGLQLEIDLAGGGLIAEDKYRAGADAAWEGHAVRRERLGQLRPVQAGDVHVARGQLQAASLDELADCVEHLAVRVDAVLVHPLRQAEAMERDLLVHEQRRRNDRHAAALQRVHDQLAAWPQRDRHTLARLAAQGVDGQARHHLAERLDKLAEPTVVAEHVRGAQLHQLRLDLVERRVVGHQVDGADLEHVAELHHRLADWQVRRVLDDGVAGTQPAKVLEQPVGGAKGARARQVGDGH
mmetsp:Transcript_470/g.1627  ORF Transcript_470/g.1627 Transcript_470/m.1627 type:complete len:367 (+) Transcript_470:515-1615(+)